VKVIAFELHRRMYYTGSTRSKGLPLEFGAYLPIAESCVAVAGTVAVVVAVHL
jgi:hypothetical protein